MDHTMAASWPSRRSPSHIWRPWRTGGQLSSRLLSARSANALLELPMAEGVMEKGSIVSALLIGDLSAMPVPAGGIMKTPLPPNASVQPEDPHKC
eukprot:scaffold1686_cov43-Prasinocladus_malaysianus.AAC.1